MRKLPGRAHLVGIGGLGMVPLAELFVSAGCKVSGSDVRTLDEMMADARISSLIAASGAPGTLASVRPAPG